MHAHQYPSEIYFKRQFEEILIALSGPLLELISLLRDICISASFSVHCDGSYVAGFSVVPLIIYAPSAAPPPVAFRPFTGP